MRLALFAIVLALSQFAYAGSSSVVIAVGYNPHAPTVRLQLPADYVAVPITIQNDSKDPIKRADEIEKTYRSITEKLKQYPDLAVKPGIVSLSPREQSALKSYSGYDGGSSAQLYVLGVLKQETNVFAVTKRIYQAVNGISLSDGTKVTLGNTALGLNEPEKYRSQLLKLISKSIGETKKFLGVAGSVELEGLENPVAVMQLNEREVVLFINYNFKIQTKAA